MDLPHPATASSFYSLQDQAVGDSTAPLGDAAARPVRGGTITAQPVRGEPTPAPLVYEIWAAPPDQSWIEIYDSTASPPLRLDAVTVIALRDALGRYTPTSHTEAIGVGIRDGAVSMTVQQQWSVATVLGATLGVVALAVAVLTVFRSHRHAAQYRRLALHEAASRETERSRVAREIHDGPLQELATLARQASPQDVSAQLRTIGDELRALASGLRPPALDRFGLQPALEDLADRWANADPSLAVRVSTDGHRYAFDAELAIYRIAQEAFTNAARHGRAQTAWLFLHVEGSDLDLIVRDDGVGPPRGLSVARRGREQLVREGHFGLVGMAERAHSIGGTLTIAPGPGGVGTEIRLSLPLSAVDPSPVQR